MGVAVGRAATYRPTRHVYRSSTGLRTIRLVAVKCTDSGGLTNT